MDFTVNHHASDQRAKEITVPYNGNCLICLGDQPVAKLACPGFEYGLGLHGDTMFIERTLVPPVVGDMIK